MITLSELVSACKTCVPHFLSVLDYLSFKLCLFIVSTSLLACDDDNCLICTSGAASTCTTCDSGYFEDSGDCSE